VCVRVRGYVQYIAAHRGTHSAAAVDMRQGTYILHTTYTITHTHAHIHKCTHRAHNTYTHTPSGTHTSTRGHAHTYNPFLSHAHASVCVCAHAHAHTHSHKPTYIWSCDVVLVFSTWVVVRNRDGARGTKGGKRGTLQYNSQGCGGIHVLFTTLTKSPIDLHTNVEIRHPARAA